MSWLFNCLIMGSGSHSHRKIIWVTKWRKNDFVLFLYHLQFILSQCTAGYSFSCNLEKEYWKQVPACQVKFRVTSLSGAILLKCSTLWDVLISERKMNTVGDWVIMTSVSELIFLNTHYFMLADCHH